MDGGAAPGAVGPAGAGALHQHAEGSQLVLASLEPWPGGRNRVGIVAFSHGVESIYCSQRDRGGAESLPERVFEQEYLAEFVDDAGGVFRRVMEAATATAVEPDPAGSYVMGVDWGKQNDYTVLVVLDTVAGAMVAFDRMNRIDYAIQTERLRVLAERWNVSNIVAERNSMGEPLIEQLSRDGLPVTSFPDDGAEQSAGHRCVGAGVRASARDPVLVGELPEPVRWRLQHTKRSCAVGMMRYCAGWDAR